MDLGSAGPDAIDDYLDDSGDANNYVGHRRWVLYPPQSQMGAGSIPDIVDQDGNLLYSAANALWVISPSTDRPPTPDYVAWPPAGFVPGQVLPRKSGRWSLSMAGANFTRAQVTMTCLTTNLVVTLEPLRNGDGDNTLVWRPAFPGGWQFDRTYDVLISNILVNGELRHVNYSVTIIDPEQVQLAATRVDSTHLQLSWPWTPQSYTLQEAGALPQVANWNAVIPTPQLTNGCWSILINPAGTQKYFRLR